jgi:LPS sulfotransferase NodH
VSARGYIICSEHRSGSTALCQWLSSTGLLGHPAEYFARTEHSVAIERDPALLATLLNRATTPNGVWGIKLFSQQFDATMKARWIERLPAAHFILLERHDLLGQAISLVRALQTRAYRAHEAAVAPARYDARAIRRQMGRLAQAQARWRLFFARNGIEPLWLTYEEMVRDPNAVVRAVARHIDVDDPPPIDPRLIKVTVQRDTVSDAWRARFIAEGRDLGFLDHPLGRPRVWIRRVARDVGLLLRRVDPSSGDPVGVPELGLQSADRPFKD